MFGNGRIVGGSIGAQPIADIRNSKISFSLIELPLLSGLASRSKRPNSFILEDGNARVGPRYVSAVSASYLRLVREPARGAHATISIRRPNRSRGGFGGRHTWRPE